LNNTLKERSTIPYKFVIYHVAAFPSVRKWDGSTAKDIRKHWVPLFEEYGVSAVFENHDHAYKRSKLLKRGVVDPTGVLYFGDGGWAVDARTPKTPEEVWEWVNDWYSDSYANDNLAQGPSSGTTKTIKGGCYDSTADGVRVAERMGLPLDHADPYTGFRVAD
jgi:hypothetical protein